MMKYVLTGIFSLLFCWNKTLYAQVHLSGKLSALGNSQVIIQYYEGETPKTETLKVTDGGFTWDAKVKEAQKITMIFPGRATWIFVDPGNMTVSGSRDSVEKLKVTGSKTNDDAVTYAALIAPLVHEEEPLLHAYGKLSEDKQTELEGKLAAINEQKHAIAVKFITAHPRSAYSLSLVTDYSRLGAYEETNRMASLLDKSLKTTAEGVRLADRITVLKRSAIGQPMKQFTLPDSSGNAISLDAYKGKYVLIDFWASWCGPCLAEMPNVQKAYHLLKDRNFEVIGISLDDRKDSWMGRMRMLRLPWIQLADLRGWDSELCVYYGLKGIPSSLLLDPEGRIVAKDLRGAALIKKLNQLLM